MAIPVTGPVESSDWTISQNGFRNTLTLREVRSEVLFSVSCSWWSPWMSGSRSSSWNEMGTRMEWNGDVGGMEWRQGMEWGQSIKTRMCI